MSSLKNTDSDSDVQYQVNYFLDMVAHDLIRNGHLPASKSYVLKTPQMKTHMEKQVKNVNRHKKAFDNKAQSRVILKPFASPITIVTDLTPKRVLPLKSKGQDTVPKVKNTLSGLAKVRKIAAAKVNEGSGPPLRISHSRTVQLSTEHHSISSSTRTLETIDTTSKAEIPSKEGKFCTRIDMNGFTNDEISLDVQERQLTITGYRPRKGIHNSRKVTEFVDVPEHVAMENLRIGRHSDGALIIEESIQH